MVLSVKTSEQFSTTTCTKEQLRQQVDAFVADFQRYSHASGEKRCNIIDSKLYQFCETHYWASVSYKEFIEWQEFAIADARDDFIDKLARAKVAFMQLVFLAMAIKSRRLTNKASVAVKQGGDILRYLLADFNQADQASERPPLFDSNSNSIKNEDIVYVKQYLQLPANNLNNVIKSLRQANGWLTTIKHWLYRNVLGFLTRFSRYIAKAEAGTLLTSLANNDNISCIKQAICDSTDRAVPEVTAVASNTQGVVKQRVRRRLRSPTAALSNKQKLEGYDTTFQYQFTLLRERLRDLQSYFSSEAYILKNHTLESKLLAVKFEDLLQEYHEKQKALVQATKAINEFAREINTTFPHGKYTKGWRVPQYVTKLTSLVSQAKQTHAILEEDLNVKTELVNLSTANEEQFLEKFNGYGNTEIKLSSVPLSRNKFFSPINDRPFRYSCKNNNVSSDDNLIKLALANKINQFLTAYVEQEKNNFVFDKSFTVIKQQMLRIVKDFNIFTIEPTKSNQADNFTKLQAFICDGLSITFCASASHTSKKLDKPTKLSLLSFLR